MSARDALHRLIAERQRGRLLLIGLGASLGWLILALLMMPDGEGTAGRGGWLIWMVGVLLPLALIWLAVWSARGLLLLRAEADELRATLARMQGQEPGFDAPPAQEPRTEPRPSPAAPSPASPSPAAPRRAPVAPPAPRPAAPSDSRQAMLELDSPAATQLTGPELFHALNFPDGPEDREAIRCLRLALADPGMARLIRAAQDVVTLLAGQGVYMDELPPTETDPALWRQFAEGARGEPVAGLAVIGDDNALRIAGAMLRGDEVFRDVAHHFLRHFDRLLTRKAQDSDPQLLAVLAETRSGRAFTLLAQVTGMLGGAADVAPSVDDQP